MILRVRFLLYLIHVEVLVGWKYRWYEDCLGMHLLRKRDVPEEKYTNVFMGYGMEDNHTAVEFTYSKYIVQRI